MARGQLVLVNDDDLTYCTLRLDDGSCDPAHRIGGIAEPLPRTLCWSAAWDMTRDGELATRDSRRARRRGCGAESDIGVMQSLLAAGAAGAGDLRRPGLGAEQG